jgi:hypothetical protein
MAREHRAAARLRYVADQQAGPAILAAASRDSFSTSRMRSGCPQRRLRDNRMACQVGPSVGMAMPPARQPLE